MAPTPQACYRASGPKEPSLTYAGQPGTSRSVNSANSAGLLGLLSAFLTIIGCAMSSSDTLGVLTDIFALSNLSSFKLLSQ